MFVSCAFVGSWSHRALYYAGFGLRPSVRSVRAAPAAQVLQGRCVSGTLVPAARAVRVRACPRDRPLRFDRA